MGKYLNIFLSDSIIFNINIYDSDEIKNDEIIKHINNGLTELRNSINSKEITENENKKK